MAEMLKLDGAEMLLIIQALTSVKETLEQMFSEHQSECKKCSEERKCFRFHEMEVTILVYKELINRFHKAL